jgi:hypothetical protein
VAEADTGGRGVGNSGRSEKERMDEPKWTEWGRSAKEAKSGWGGKQRSGLAIEAEEDNIGWGGKYGTGEEGNSGEGGNSHPAGPRSMRYFALRIYAVLIQKQNK